MENLRKLWQRKKLEKASHLNYELMVKSDVSRTQVKFLINDQEFMDTVLEMCEDLTNDRNEEVREKLKQMGTTKALVALQLLMEKAKIADKK